MPCFTKSVTVCNFPGAAAMVVQGWEGRTRPALVLNHCLNLQEF